MKTKTTADIYLSNERRRDTIYELAARITEQRQEVKRLHAKADREEERFMDLLDAIKTMHEKTGLLDHHDPDCHISTCPEKDGCEVRDGSYLGDYMDHNCTCGLDTLRWRVGLTQRVRPDANANRTGG